MYTEACNFTLMGLYGLFRCILARSGIVGPNSHSFVGATREHKCGLAFLLTKLDTMDFLCMPFECRSDFASIAVIELDNFIVASSEEERRLRPGQCQ